MYQRPINPPRLQKATKPSADQASSRASTPSRSTGPVLHGHPSEDGTERESFDVIALAQEQVDIPNLKHLRIQAAARYMTENNLEDARICQFEVPGCGECRDLGCGDMHLSQVQVEPNDDETARYLCGDPNVSEVVQALQAARTRRPEATFDERVNEVWASMRDRWIQATLDNKT
ncbi:hypothetical protein BJV78DRAFT_351394 [Lactifluus subvellereus]|nr:hypothetical protein BJV78DRAFT_351394 [Lactifluus subvellereus]